MSKLTLVTPPSGEPVTTDELRTHLRVDHDQDNADINAKAIAARRWAEHFQGRAYLTQTWDWALDAFPAERKVELPMPPLSSVTSITYSDSDDSSQTFGATNYQTVTYTDDIGFLELDPTVSWPATYDKADAVTIRFIAGYGTADAVPHTMRQAILLHTRYAYDGDPADLEAAQALLWQERVTIV